MVFFFFSNLFFSDSIKHYFTLIVEMFEKNKNIFVSPKASFVIHCYKGTMINFSLPRPPRIDFQGQARKRTLRSVPFLPNFESVRKPLLEIIAFYSIFLADVKKV